MADLELIEWACEAATITLDDGTETLAEPGDLFLAELQSSGAIRFIERVVGQA